MKHSYLKCALDTVFFTMITLNVIKSKNEIGIEREKVSITSDLYSIHILNYILRKFFKDPCCSRPNLKKDVADLHHEHLHQAAFFLSNCMVLLAFMKAASQVPYGFITLVLSAPFGVLGRIVCAPYT